MGYPTEMNNYFAKNNSIGVMDPLLINRQIIKSGMGFPTAVDPVVGNYIDTVNSLGTVSVVSGKSVTMKPRYGFHQWPFGVMKYNSDKPMHVGKYYYQGNSGLSYLGKIYDKVNRSV